MEAKEHFQAGRLQEALSSLQEAVRKAPADTSLRIFLFELQSVLGDWEKALRQLPILADLNSDCFLLAQAFRPVIECELLRADVFSGKRTPLIFGEPEPWMSWLVQASYLIATGEIDASRELREKAFDEAPASSGTINGARFDWIADADSRLGPLLEVILEGKYYWVPFSRISAIQIEPPKQVRDLVWIAARFTWSNGGDAMGLILVRYPGTETSSNNALRMARKTDWEKKGEGLFIGIGQRMFATDKAEYPLLETRQIELAQSPESISTLPENTAE